MFNKLTPALHRNRDVSYRSNGIERMVKKNHGLSLRKGEYFMKKIGMMIVTVVLMCVALTGCSSLKQDETHAIVTLKTSTGQAYVGRSFNGAGMNLSGQDAALRYKSEVVLKKGEKAVVTFKCDACGNEQEYEVHEPWAETLSCDCPEKIDKKGNAKEYTAISISFEY